MWQRREPLLAVLGLLVSGALLGLAPSAALGDPERDGRCGPSADQEAESAAQDPSEDTAEAGPAAPGDATEASPGEMEVDPCHLDDAGAAWLDIVQRGIFRSVCSSARWFDGLFGGSRFDGEAAAPWGRLSVDTVYDELEGLEASVGFRAEVDLPTFDQRLKAFLGREDEEDFVSARNEDFEQLPELFREDVDRQWLFGLGYRPVRGGGGLNRFDFRVGVKLRFPLEPFVQARLRRYWFLSDSRLVRFRNTAFWRNQRGFGDTVTVDVEQAVGPPLLLRWSGSATFAETTRGVDWGTSVTLYPGLGGLRAVSYTLYADGETDEAVPVERYGFRAVYRQQMLREWFFGQLIAGINSYGAPGGDREIGWELGFGFEIRYGRRSGER